MKCDNCGKAYTDELQCKLICDNCGAYQSCSDLFILYRCIHFDCEVDRACPYCENYKHCQYHEGDVNFE